MEYNLNKDNLASQMKSYEALREEVEHRINTCPTEEKKAWYNLRNIINEKLTLAYAQDPSNHQG